MKKGELKVIITVYKGKIINIEEENCWGKTQMPGNSIVGDTFPGVDYVIYMVSPVTNPNLNLRVTLKEHC